jgi:hypothetical protein
VPRAVVVIRHQARAKSLTRTRGGFAAGWPLKMRSGGATLAYNALLLARGSD